MWRGGYGIELRLQEHDLTILNYAKENAAVSGVFQDVYGV